MRFIVDTYLPFDTGGPEALVQLSIALQSALRARGREYDEHEAFVWRKKVASRMFTEYPTLKDVPTYAHAAYHTRPPTLRGRFGGLCGRSPERSCACARAL